MGAAKAMKREDVEKLLGGYAAGILTPQEREALFTAALDDQQLFDVLVREEPLRELLQDPGARAQLLDAVGETPAPWYCRQLSHRAIAAVAAAGVSFAVLLYWQPWRRQALNVAQVEPHVITVHPETKPFQAPSDSSLLRPVPSPLPRQLPPPPPLPVTSAPSPALAFAEHVSPPPPPAVGQAAVSSANAQVMVEAAQITAALRTMAAGANAPPPAAPAPARPSLSFRAAESATLGLRYHIMKKLPGGELTEVPAQQELERDDEVIMRFEPAERGYLYVLQRNAQSGWQPFATEFVQEPGPLDLPRNNTVHADSGGSKEFFVVFSRVPLNNINPVRFVAGSANNPQAVRPMSSFGTTSVVTRVAEPGRQEVSFRITLKYK